uniref:glutathione transferase n=1 Tax=Diabrotica virgifera virgifera TaxID=50390 RepID=A0A6P7GHN4_DIAVI
MAHTYKVRYFNFTARGEPIRMLLSYGEIPFEDERIAREDWPKIKPTTPLGQLPVLEIDGKQIPHSISICRYLASIVKLDGKDARENLRIDVAVETLLDLQKLAFEYVFETDAAKKDEKNKKVKESVPLFLGKLEEHAKQNGGYTALDRVCIKYLESLVFNTKLNNVVDKESFSVLLLDTGFLCLKHFMFNLHPVYLKFLYILATPLGQLPLLEVDGKAIPQSTAICRYLASIVKLDGKDAKENLALDVALETLFDLQKMNGEIKYEQDAAKKKEKLEKLLQQGLPLYFGKLDEYAKKHNGYIAFERLSWADILFVCVYEALVNLAGKEAVASYPSLQQVKKNVLATKGINKWIKNRPAVEGYDLKQDL